jgi:hypothetical protein
MVPQARSAARACGRSRSGRTRPAPPPVGARILRLAVDFDALEAHGADPVVVVAAMRGRPNTWLWNLTASAVREPLMVIDDE